MPVYQFLVFDADVDGILYDLLRLDLPAGFPDSVVVPFMRIHPDRTSDAGQMVREGRVFSRAGLAEVLDGASVSDGWFFFGAPGQPGDTVTAVNVGELLGCSAFAVDILEGRFLGVRTVVEAAARTMRKVVVGAREVEPCDVGDVRLAY